MGACASYPVVAESPHEPPAEAAVGLSEVLRQLPADVVCAEIWPHLDNLPAFKLSGRAARNLVHSTQRRVVLRPERWGGGSAAELKLVAAALARYVAVDTLVLDAAPLGVLGAARGLLVGLEAGRHWRVHELLRLASPFLGLRVRHWRSERMYGVADFPALPGSCLPGLCTLEGVRLAGCGSAAPLAALPHLTACSVAFYKTTTDLQKEIYAVGQLAQGLMRLRLAGVTKYPRSCLPDYIRICGYYFYLPGGWGRGGGNSERRVALGAAMRACSPVALFDVHVCARMIGRARICLHAHMHAQCNVHLSLGAWMI